MSGSVRAGCHTGFFNFVLHANVQFAHRVGLATHSLVGGSGFAGFLAFADELGESLADQAFVVFCGNPGGAELLAQAGLVRVQLPVEVLKLLADFQHAREVRSALDAELGQFLFELAVARMELPEGVGELAGFAGRTGIKGQQDFRVVLRGGTILGFAQEPFRICGGKLLSQLVHFHHCGEMAAGGGRPVRQRFRSDEDAVFLLEGGQTAIVVVGPGLQVAQLVLQPEGGFAGWPGCAPVPVPCRKRR